MQLKFLGTGTSQGIPVIGSDHPVCLSHDSKDKRLRSSVLVTTGNHHKILIDCGPDFRQQMLVNNEDNIDAVLITHEHNDHVIGLDDMRPIIFRKGEEMNIYAMERVAHEIVTRFPYAFSEIKYPGAPSFEMNIIRDPFELFGQSIIPIEVMHHMIPIFGYRFDNLAYITDASFISEESKEKLKNLDYLIINCLRKEEEHPAHFILPQVLELIEELQPKKSYLTHISHLLGFHKEVEAELPHNVQLAYDGLTIDF